VLQLGGDKRLEKFFREPGEGWLDRARSLFPVHLATFWGIQALWGIVCMLPVTLVSAVPAVPLDRWSTIIFTGVAMGLTLEVVADCQKYRFKQMHKDRWCDVGLWSWCRHPNYLGELAFWWSLYAMSLPALPSRGLRVFALASPVFISTLILCLSGVPLLEKAHEEKYGRDPAYQQYKRTTPLLLPSLWEKEEDDQDL